MHVSEVHIKILLFMLAVISRFFCFSGCAQSDTGHRCLIIAHRGGSPAEGENTTAAFHRAVAHGYDAIELDVRLTSDHKAAVIHDATLNRTSYCRGKVSSYSMSALSECKNRINGEGIPSLAEVVSSLQGKVLMIIEMKSGEGEETAIAEATAQALEGYPSEMFQVQSFSITALYHFNRIRPDISTAVLSVKPKPSPDSQKWDTGAQVWKHASSVAVHYRFASAAFIRRMHREGKKVNVWTVNRPCALKRMLRRGADGIITDRPEILAKILQEK